MSLRSEALNAFLADGALLPFVYGERDCAIWVADWIKSQNGRDPALRLRGTFDSAFGSLRLVHRAGGLAGLVAGLMERLRLPETAEPQLGDVGVISTRKGELAAICTGDRWAVKTKDGIAIVKASPVKAWTV